MESHLLQMRGLKLYTNYKPHNAHCVASFTDAWIETSRKRLEASGSLRRIFYRCVD